MALALIGSGLAASAAVAAATPQEILLARAKALELDTPLVPPPGDPLEHYAAGFAQIMCSAVFITGLEPQFAAENVGYFTAPYAQRSKLGRPVIDRVAKTVRVAVPDGPAAVLALTERLRPGDVVLVKASRAAGLQTVALALAKQEATR